MISYCIVTNTEMRGHKDMADFDIAAFANMKLNYCHLAFNIFHLNISKKLHITFYTFTSGGAALHGERVPPAPLDWYFFIRGYFLAAIQPRSLKLPI